MLEVETTIAEDIRITDNTAQLDAACKPAAGNQNYPPVRNYAHGNMAKGLARGRAEGIVNGVIASIKNLVKNTGLPVEQAMTTLGVPQEEWSKYVELLAKQQ